MNENRKIKFIIIRIERQKSPEIESNQVISMSLRLIINDKVYNENIHLVIKESEKDEKENFYLPEKEYLDL